MGSAGGRDPQNIKLTVFERVLGFIWLVLVVVFTQAAIASGSEFEPRAAVIFYLIVGTLILGGLVYWIVRQSRLL